MIKTLGPVLLIAAFFVVSSYSRCPKPVTGIKYNSFAPLFRYYHYKVIDHFYTTNWNEIGEMIPGRRGKHGYTTEGIACMLVTRRMSPRKNLVPLYRYFKGGDHFYTTNSGEIGTTRNGQLGKHGYRSEGIAGYCYSKPTKDTVPFYRYWKPQRNNHFYTTNPAEIGTTTPGRRGRLGYISEGVACYVHRFELLPK